MSKQAEQNYLTLTGEAGRQHSLGKPFSDNYCGVNLASIGTIMSLLPPPPARILDMGCGGGWTSVFFAKNGYEVVGQDISQDMIDLAHENQANQNIDARLSFLCNDYEGMDVDGQFDAVVFYDCLDHAEDERAAIATAYRALKPGGIPVTHEPGEGHATAPGSIEAMQLYGVTERDMPPHLIIRHGQELGFSEQRVFPIPQELLEVFYNHSIPPLLSKAAWRRAKRVLRIAFRPSNRISSIVIMTK
ncbi:class I SAM-dependent methyltransferase [Sphingobium aromaticiconvertens]|uniref:class I SAM-dependent methyltransferase n=1 Tax=Sphingobium aromaticiconvertens TaxID=365341 RepID=UPI00301A6EA9